MPHAEPHGGQVVGDFGRRRRDPVLHAGAERVEPRVELRIDERGGRRRSRQHAAERREEQPAAELLDRVVVELVVERELGRGSGSASAYEASASNTTLCARPLRLNSGSRIVGSAAQNGMLARTPTWPHSRWMSLPLRSCAPVAELAERVGHDLERRDVDRPVDLLPRDEPLALAGDRVAEAVDFPRQQRPLARAASGSSAAWRCRCWRTRPTSARTR